MADKDRAGNITAAFVVVMIVLIFTAVFGLHYAGVWLGPLHDGEVVRHNR